MESAAPQNKIANQSSPLSLLLLEAISIQFQTWPRETRKNQNSANNKNELSVLVCIHRGSGTKFSPKVLFNVAAIVCKEKEIIPFLGPRKLKLLHLSQTPPSLVSNATISSPTNPRIPHSLIRFGKTHKFQIPFPLRVTLILIHGKI